MESLGPPASAFDSSAKKGWLTKVGGQGFKRNWKRRWFVMEDNYIYYYRTPDDKEPVGIISLEHFNSCTQATEEECKRSRFCWKLSNTSDSSVRVYYAYDDTWESMKSWIAAISKQLQGGEGDEESKFPDSKTNSIAPTLNHVTKTRPVQKGKRAPSRRPPPKTFDEDIFSSDEEKDKEKEIETPVPAPRKILPASPIEPRNISGAVALMPVTPHPPQTSQNVFNTYSGFSSNNINNPVSKINKPLPADPFSNKTSSSDSGGFVDQPPGYPKSIKPKKDLPPDPFAESDDFDEQPRSPKSQYSQYSQFSPRPSFNSVSQSDEDSSGSIAAEKQKAKELLKKAQEMKNEMAEAKKKTQEEYEKAHMERMEAEKLRAEVQRLKEQAEKELREAKEIKELAKMYRDQSEQEIYQIKKEMEVDREVIKVARREAEEIKEKAKEILKRALDAKTDLQKNMSFVSNGE